MPKQSNSYALSQTRKPSVSDHHFCLSYQLDAQTNQSNNGYIQITLDGVFKSKDGRPEGLPGFKVNPQIAAALLNTLKQRKDDIAIDYEHQTLLVDANGQPAPAAGWVNPQDIEYIEGKGFFSPCKWTDRALKFIKDDEYRYISPVIEINPETGAIIDIPNIGLVNWPALDGMQVVEALKQHSPQAFNQEDTNMLETLIKLLGLPEGSTQEDVQKAIQALLAVKSDEEAVRAELKLKDSESLPKAVAALKSKATPDPEKYVHVTVVEALKTDLAALKNAQTQSELQALVEQGLKDGKVLPAQKDWAMSLSVEALKSYLDKTPAIVALSGAQATGKPPVNDDGHTAEAQEVYDQIGVTIESKGDK